MGMLFEIINRFLPDYFCKGEEKKALNRQKPPVSANYMEEILRQAQYDNKGYTKKQKYFKCFY